MKVLQTIKHYVILDNGKDLVVKNAHGKYENHAHLYKRRVKGHIKLDTALLLIKLCDQQKIPRSKYLIGSCIRLTTDQDYKDTLERILRQRADHQKYFNVNKGRV